MSNTTQTTTTTETTPPEAVMAPPATDETVASPLATDDDGPATEADADPSADTEGAPRDSDEPVSALPNTDEADRDAPDLDDNAPAQDDAKEILFADLGLSDKVLKAVHEAGYTKPTPIQAQAIPVALEGRDVLGLAQTGTGKTASFTLPMINMLAKGRGRARMPRSLILAPTRELAMQVAENFEKYGKYVKLTMALLIGGVSFSDQEQKLDKGVDVLIATPGRLIDHFERGKVLLNGVQVLVIDEADRMLDMGFIPDIEKIVKLTPFTRQTLFFSATMPNEINELTRKFLQNPERIEVAKTSSTAETVYQAVCQVRGEEKREALRQLIRANDVKNAIIFCNRKRDVSVLFKSLTRHGFNVAALHGDLDQRVRMQVLDQFRKGNIQLLVASDVAARGLDIPDVSHVFNFDVPFNSEDYVHRIGRTGRAGRTGHAFMISTASDGKNVVAIEKLIGKPIPVIEVEGLDAPDTGEASADTKDEETDANGKRRRGRRGGRNRRREGEAEVQAEARPAPRPARARSDEDEQPRSREDTRGRNGSRRSSRTPETEDRSSVAAASRDQNRRSRRGGRRRHDDDDPPVIGLGDHVPAFLLRPVRVTKVTKDADEPHDTDETSLDEADADDDLPIAQTA